MGRRHVLKLTGKQQDALTRLVARPSEAAGLVRRARVALLSAEGVRGIEIARRLALSAEQVSRIRCRFVDAGVEGLAERPRTGRKDHAVPAVTVERIVRLLGQNFKLLDSRISSRRFVQLARMYYLGLEPPGDLGQG
jgi:hypothetical protein